MSTIKTAVFDVYNTLLNISVNEDRIEAYEFLSSWLSYKGLTTKPVALMRLYKEITKKEIESNPEDFPDIDIGSVFEKIIFSIDNKYSGDIRAMVSEFSLLFRIYTTQSLKIYPHVITMLETLSNNVTLAIISNTQRHFTLPELKKFGIEKFFNTILFSSDARASKPNPKIFNTLLNTMNINPEQTVYIGDNFLDDIWGAQRVGMKTIWINRGCKATIPCEFQKTVPDKQIDGSSYKDLTDIIISMTKKRSKRSFSPNKTSS